MSSVEPQCVLDYTLFRLYIVDLPVLLRSSFFREADFLLNLSQRLPTTGHVWLSQGNYLTSLLESTGLHYVPRHKNSRNRCSPCTTQPRTRYLCCSIRQRNVLLESASGIVTFSLTAPFQSNRCWGSFRLQSHRFLRQLALTHSTGLGHLRRSPASLW